MIDRRLDGAVPGRLGANGGRRLGVRPGHARTMRAGRYGRVVHRVATGVALLALTACGSTVQLSGTAAGPGTTTDGLGLSGTAGGTPGDGPGTNGPVPQGAGSTDRTGVGPGVNPQPGQPSAGGTSGGAAGGVTSGSSGSRILSPSVVKVGLQYSSNASATLSALGSSSQGRSGDPKASYHAVINYVNKHGGVAGRRMQAVFDDVDATASPSRMSQQSCTKWSQDERVSVALPASAVQDNALLRTCMGKAGIPVMYGNVFSTTRANSFASSPLWLESIGTSLESYARTYVAGLARQGFFKGGKVGVVYYESPDFKAALQSALLPALKQAGVPAPEIYAANISGASDLSNGSAQMSSAVLNFRSAGVNKVMFFEPWVGYFTFLKAAENQGYFPQYALTSQSAPEVMMSLGLASAASLKNAKLVSWWPLADVRDISKYLGPRQQLCQSIYRNAGVTIPSDRTAFGGLLNLCENILLVADAYRGAPAQLRALDFTLGLERLGLKAQFATKPSGGFASNRHWGATTYYPGTFDSDCGCFKLLPSRYNMVS